jgi:hypothetical protein
MYSQTTHPLFYTIGSDETIETTNVLTGDNVYHIRGENNNFDVIPEHKVMDAKTEILVHNQITNAGNYDLFAGKDLITGVSFNFNRKESDLSCYTIDELKEQLSKNNFNNFNVLVTGAQSLKQTLSESGQGKKLWKFCIILALLFLAIEVLLLRFMKG